MEQRLQRLAGLVGAKTDASIATPLERNSTAGVGATNLGSAVTSAPPQPHTGLQAPAGSHQLPARVAQLERELADVMQRCNCHNESSAAPTSDGHAGDTTDTRQ